MSRKNKKNILDCHEATALIDEYIEGSLSDRELEHFLAHIDDCPRCFDELETAFMIDRTVHYLDNDHIGSLNMTPLFRQDLVLRKKDLVHRRRIRRLRTTIIVITALLIAFALLDRLGFFRITVFLGSILL